MHWSFERKNSKALDFYKGWKWRKSSEIPEIFLDKRKTISKRCNPIWKYSEGGKVGRLTVAFMTAFGGINYYKTKD